MVINGNSFKTDKKVDIKFRITTNRLLVLIMKGDASHVKMAIEASLAAKAEWENMHGNSGLLFS
jgi:hypothetical protein